MSASQKIKEIIESKGITYTFISSKTGISVDAISRTMAGKRKLPADEMIAICEAVGIDLCDLQREDSPN